MGPRYNRVIQRQYSLPAPLVRLPHLRWLRLMEALLEQGQHLTHGCRNWKPVHHVETGPAVAA